MTDLPEPIKADIDLDPSIFKLVLGFNQLLAYLREREGK